MRSSWERIECARGDLTLEHVDAIVNAASESLRGGGGVDGAIHRAAGPDLLAECLRAHPDGCPTGEVRLTGGHALRAGHVIHAVGPVWRGGAEGEPALLAACYSGALALAAEHGLSTLAFPAISCGVFGYPAGRAADVALAALKDGLDAHGGIQVVRLVLFSDELFAVWNDARERLSRT